MAVFFAVGFRTFLQHTSLFQCLLNICGDYAEQESPLIATKQLVYFPPKSMNKLVHQMFSKLCMCTVI